MVRSHDGALFAIGYNRSGELGLGDRTRRERLTRVPPLAARGGGARVACVTCGWKHTVVVDDEGGLWACGANDHGELGVGTHAGRDAFARVGALPAHPDDDDADADDAVVALSPSAEVLQSQGDSQANAIEIF